jgi:tRNA pseudouridine38-40 synthase
MTRYKINLEYDGTSYNGWQKQKDAPTIQNAIEEAIKNFCQQETTVLSAGRTDAGVHALNQVAHFDLNGDFDTRKIIMGVNNHLREACLKKNREFCNSNLRLLLHFPIQDIIILDCQIVDNKFHSRFSAKKRSYKYRILNRNTSNPLEHNRVWHIYEKLDLDKMQKAAECLIGKHDFSSFRDSDCQASSPIKTVDEIKLYRKEQEIIFEITAKSFLHHMARNIVGTLKKVGNGTISVNEFKEILNAKDRRKAGITAPACGLYFVNVEY